MQPFQKHAKKCSPKANELKHSKTIQIIQINMEKEKQNKNLEGQTVNN